MCSFCNLSYQGTLRYNVARFTCKGYYMTLMSALALAGAMTLLAASPGPGVFAVTARALASGFTHGALLALGCVLGDLVFLLMAVYGLSALASVMGEVFIAVKYLGGAYLIYLGVQILRSSAKGRNIQGSKESALSASFVSGFFITLGNPKVILFYLSFLPTFMNLQALSGADVVLVATIVSVVLGTVLCAYAWMAHRAKALFTSPKALRRMDVGAGSAMVGAGGFLLLKPL